MKKKWKRLFACVLAGVMACQCLPEGAGMIRAAEKEEGVDMQSNEKEKAYVILLSGQSNASGQTLSSCLEQNCTEEKMNEYRKGYENIQIFYNVDGTNNASEFVPVALGQGNNDDSVEKFGPEIGIAEYLTEQYPGRKFYIIKASQSGSSIAADWQEQGSAYQNAINGMTTGFQKLKDKNLEPVWFATCWMQGESDALNLEYAEKYYQLESELMNRLQTKFSQELAEERYAFIDAGISNHTEWVYQEQVNSAKKQYASEGAWRFYLDTQAAGLTYNLENNDPSHYDSLSMIQLGRMFGAKIAKAASDVPVLDESRSLNLASDVKDGAIKRQILPFVTECEATSKTPTWNYQTTVNYSKLEGWAGVELVFAEAKDENGASKDLKAVFRATNDDWIQSVIWIGSYTTYEGDYTELVERDNGLQLQTGTDYTLTVQYANGTVSFWIEGIFLKAGVDTDEKILVKTCSLQQVTDVVPKFGMSYSGGVEGSYKDVKIWGDIAAPYNLMDECTNTPSNLSTSVLYEFGKEVTATSDTPTWNYSGKISFNSAPTGYTPAEFIFAQITYKGNTRYLKAHIDNSGDASAMRAILFVGHTDSNEAGSGGAVLTVQSGSAKLQAQEYEFWVTYAAGKVTFSIPNLFEIKYDVGTNADISDVKPCFGLRSGLAGNISNVKIWGDVKAADMQPTIGTAKNWTDGRTIPTAFSGNTQYLDLGKLEKTKDSATWYYSGTFRYTDVPGNYNGLKLIFGKDQNGNALAVQVRNQGADSTLGAIWQENYDDSLVYSVNISNYPYTQTGKDYTFTVKVSGTKISFWIGRLLIMNEIDISNRDKNIISVSPAFGFISNSTKGTLSDLQVWGDLEKRKRPVDAANFVDEVTAITAFPAATPVTSGGTKAVQYYDNDKIKITGDTWYYSGTFTYSSLNTWNGLAVVFAKAVYSDSSDSSDSKETPIVGTRDLAVSVRNTNDGLDALIWVDAERENQIFIKRVFPSGEALKTGVEYTYTIKVENTKLTFWLDDTPIFENYDLTNDLTKHVSDIQPNFGYVAMGSKGTISDVEIWDGSAVATPVFADSDENIAILEEVKVTDKTGTLLFAGLTYGDNWNYSATVSSLNDATLLLGKEGNTNVTVQSLLGDATVPTANTYHCLVKCESGRVSVWINDTLYVINREMTDFQSGAGVVASGNATVSDIRLWEDVTDADSVLYQKIDDIAPYRNSELYTYPTMNGYVFGGWYQTADETTPISTDTVSGSAYAKLVPEEVLSVKAQAGTNASYDSKENTRLRFVTTVDSTNYTEVGFDVTINGKMKELRSDTVYYTIQACVGENDVSYEPNVFHKTAKCFNTISIGEIPCEAFNVPIIVVPIWTTQDGTTVEGVEREIAVNDQQNRRITETQLGNGLGGSKLIQVGSGTKGNQGQMMSYIIEAYNPENSEKPYVIVIDGGMVDDTKYAGSDAEYLEWLLNENYGGHVDAWFITHEHEDHFGSLLNMLRVDKIGIGEGQISIDKLYYNFPEIKNRNQWAVEFLELAPTKLSEEQIVDYIPKGTEYTFGRVKMTVLSDCREYYGEIYKDGASGDQNNASTLLLAQFYLDDTRDILSEQALFLGDMGKKGEDKAFAAAVQVAKEKGITLQGSVIQMAHHGNSGTSKALYEWLEPKACLWPCTNWLWQNMDRTTLIPGTGNWETKEIYQFLMAKGYTTHYTAVDGTYVLK